MTWCKHKATTEFICFHSDSHKMKYARLSDDIRHVHEGHNAKHKKTKWWKLSLNCNKNIEEISLIIGNDEIVQTMKLILKGCLSRIVFFLTRTLSKGWEAVIFPSYSVLWAWPAATFIGNKRKIEPKRLPSWLIPCLPIFIYLVTYRYNLSDSPVW